MLPDPEGGVPMSTNPEYWADGKSPVHPGSERTRSPEGAAEAIATTRSSRGASFGEKYETKKEKEQGGSYGDADIPLTPLHTIVNIAT